jgi:hypothetical protein
MVTGSNGLRYLRKQDNLLSSKHGKDEQRWGNRKPKAGSGRSTAAVSLSNRMMAIEPVFVHANEIIPPRLPINVPGFLEKNAISAAMPPSAAPESRKSRKSGDLRPICHVTISCDYRE